MLRKDAKTKLIQRVPLFANCSKREVAKVAAIADEIDLREGKELTRQGSPGREFFVLVDGSAEVVKDGKRINSLGHGDFFGEIALIHHAPRTATVKATSPVRALVVTERNFKRLLEESPEIQRKVLAALAERLAPQTI
ncbi:MAG TPA: cyclic nucleotide-binding domain-containing protein [Gaiellaceae bacterium]|jgi:CRP-like cAMP-binding protein|nr:cyclic nucleotide-binding domain-containing protein [Gaiellaceae bacterium]